MSVSARAASGALSFLLIYPGFSMAAPSSPTATCRRASGTAEVNGGVFFYRGGTPPRLSRNPMFPYSIVK